jgi:hypothetical protein
MKRHIIFMVQKINIIKILPKPSVIVIKVSMTHLQNQKFFLKFLYIKGPHIVVIILVIINLKI